MKNRTISVLSTILGAAVGTGVGAAAATKTNKKNEQKYKQLADKHLALMLLLNQWLATKQEGKSILDYFRKNEIKSVAIYGMSYVGERVLNELKESDIEVKYAIDKNVEGIYADIEVVSPDEQLAEVDAVIVTPIFFFEEIEEMLSEKMNCKILSLEDILYEI